LHEYSGGEVVEHSSTTLSPILWGFWAIVIVVIVGTLVISGAIPGLHVGGIGYPRPGLATNEGYTALQGQVTSATSTYGDPNNQSQYIDMYRLPLPAGQNLTQAITAGTDIYQNKCIGCHGPNQDGNGPNALSLNPSPRNLRDLPFMQAMSLQRISTSIHKGVPGTAMPRWEGTLSDDQIHDVIAYVFSLTAPVDAKGNFVDVSAPDYTQSSTTPTQASAM
jgi:mono/diheme cytochrome c family protein